MKSTKFKITEQLELGHLATFVPNKKLPVYNWFYYKEGFARDMVFLLLETFRIKKGQTVLDPFCGVGTTPLACKEKGINSTGFDVNPIGVFAARVKTRDYDINELENAIKSIPAMKFKTPEYRITLPIVSRAYPKRVLDEIMFYKEEMLKIKNETSRDFLLLALMNVSTRCTLAVKSGGCIKIDKTRSIPPVRKMLRRTLKRMLEELKEFQPGKTDVKINFGDARRMNSVENESIDAVITSPPYLNKIEYTNVYAIEQYLFFGDISKPAVRSFIGEYDREIDDVFDGKYELDGISKAYFKDMKIVLNEMFRVLKKKGNAAIIVGNGCFPEGVVESDIMLSELAEKIGFKVRKIRVLNKRWCMKHRSMKVGMMNESLILLEKP